MCAVSSRAAAQGATRSTAPADPIAAQRVERPFEYGVAHDRDALPGTWRVPSPLSSPTVLAISAMAGYGWTEPERSGRDEHHRLMGSLALAVQPLRWL